MTKLKLSECMYLSEVVSKISSKSELNPHFLTAKSGSLSPEGLPLCAPVVVKHIKIGHSGDIYTTATDRCYQSETPSLPPRPLVKHSPSYHWTKVFCTRRCTSVLCRFPVSLPLCWYLSLQLVLLSVSPFSILRTHLTNIRANSS